MLSYPVAKVNPSKNVDPAWLTIRSYAAAAGWIDDAKRATSERDCVVLESMLELQDMSIGKKTVLLMGDALRNESWVNECDELCAKSRRCSDGGTVRIVGPSVSKGRVDKGMTIWSTHRRSFGCEVEDDEPLDRYGKILINSRCHRACHHLGHLRPLLFLSSLFTTVYFVVCALTMQAKRWNTARACVRSWVVSLNVGLSANRT